MKTQHKRKKKRTKQGTKVKATPPEIVSRLTNHFIRSHQQRNKRTR